MKNILRIIFLIITIPILGILFSALFIFLQYGFLHISIHIFDPPSWPVFFKYAIIFSIIIAIFFATLYFKKDNDDDL